jgi:hypothetical protein
VAELSYQGRRIAFTSERLGPARSFLDEAWTDAAGGGEGDGQGRKATPVAG